VNEFDHFQAERSYREERKGREVEKRRQQPAANTKGAIELVGRTRGDQTATLSSRTGYWPSSSRQLQICSWTGARWSVWSSLHA